MNLSSSDRRRGGRQVPAAASSEAYGTRTKSIGGWHLRMA